jgi:hypothetical protein
MPQNSRRPLQLAALFALGALASGCADNGTITSTLANSIGNPFGGPSEAGFLERVRHYCAAYPIGDSTVGSLLASDPTFKSLASRLYRGDVSNDAFAFQVLELHPADDANVPGTGCIINQLDACFNRRCRAPDTPAAAPLPPTENTEDAAMGDLLDTAAAQTADAPVAPSPTPSASTEDGAEPVPLDARPSAPPPETPKPLP